MEEFLPATCLEKESADSHIRESSTDPPSVVDFLVSACTFLLGVLPGGGVEQQAVLLGGPEEHDAVQVALRTLHVLLEGRKTGGLLRMARKVR